jgi:hypothetical protein
MEKLAKRSIELYYRDESESAVLSCLCDLIQRHLEESNTSPEDGRKYTMRHNKWIQAATAANAILDETALPEKKSAKKGRK